MTAAVSHYKYETGLIRSSLRSVSHYECETEDRPSLANRQEQEVGVDYPQPRFSPRLSTILLARLIPVVSASILERVDTGLQRLANLQDGLFTVAQARSCGYDDDAIRSMMRGRNWRRLQRAVYGEPQLELTPRVRARAVALTTSGGAVVSRQTAARLHGIEFVRGTTWEHATVPRPVHLRTRPTLRVHGGTLRDGDVIDLGGISVTSVQRTLLDLLRFADRLTAVWACEHSLRTGLVSLEELARLDDRVVGEPGARQIHQRLALVAPMSQSPLETGVRLTLHDAGLPVPTLQHPVVDERGLTIWFLDMAYPVRRIAVETDGKVHEQAPAVFRDRTRDNELQNNGWVVLRFTWDDLIRRPGYIVATVRGALDSRAA